MNTLISIIIPVYNAEHYISDTIKSCLNQTYRNVEVIVVNDGSIDNSENIILNFDDNRIKYYKIQNGGPCNARNYGISLASGDLIQFLDHDDVLDARKLEMQIKYYRIHGNEFIYSGTMGSISNKNKSVDRNYTAYYRNFSPAEYFKTLLSQFDKYLTTGIWLVPKSILKKTYGWDSRAGLNDDGEFFSRVIINSKGIIYCKEAIFYFRRDAVNSLSKQFNTKEVYIKWLYSYKSYVNTFASHFDKKLANELGRKALSVYYCSSYPHYPDLLKECRDKIRALGFKSASPHGGWKLRFFSFIVGVDNALKLYALKNGIKKTV